MLYMVVRTIATEFLKSMEKSAWLLDFSVFQNDEKPYFIHCFLPFFKTRKIVLDKPSCRLLCPKFWTVEFCFLTKYRVDSSLSMRILPGGLYILTMRCILTILHRCPPSLPCSPNPSIHKLSPYFPNFSYPYLYTLKSDINFQSAIL